MKYGTCIICGWDITKQFIIPHMPISTFQISDETMDLPIGECESCGAVQLVNVPLSPDYAVVNRSIGVSTDLRKAKHNDLANFIKRYDLHDKRWIEIGCGDGQYLDLFRELGIEAIGAESGKENIEKCLHKKFIVFDNSHSKVLPETYDVFFCSYVMEHLPNQTQIAQDLFELLKPNGLGYIEVPNYDYIEKEHIWLEFTRDHRIYYRKRTILKLLIDAGFNIESIEDNAFDPLCLTIIVRKPSLIGFELIQESMVSDLTRFEALVNKIARPYDMFGAGHYTQLLLHNLPKTKLPERIFDSNPKKCLYLIRGKPIIEKERLFLDESNKPIIICCGIFNTEVEKMLKSMDLKREIYVWN